MRPPRRPSTLMLRATPTIFALALFAALSLAPAASFAQVCEGVAYYEACLDAVAGRPMGSTAARDPTRIINGIFRTNDTPPRFAPELTFARLIPSRSVFTYPSCMGGRNTNPRMYTANECVGPLPPEQVAPYLDSLDWRFSVTTRSYSNGTLVADGDSCGGDRARCGYESPWANAIIMDLQGPANHVVIFPITDHVNDSCLEAFEYSVYLTDNVASRDFAGWNASPDPARWNAAVLVRAFTRGWTNNPASTGTVADMAVHPLEDLSSGEAVADSLTTVWSLPCGVTFRYVAIVPGNYGNPDGRCTFHSAEYEFDAVAGLNEDNTAVCVDRDNDGFRDRACGGNDCDDTNPAVNPGAVESCASSADLDCDGTTPRCPTGTTCVNGLCAPSCVEGGCAEGHTCVTPDAGGSSYCLPSPCARVTCPAGQVCGPRGCQDPCADARCPAGQVCRGGACVDPCAGVLCPMRQHCEAGRCVPNCPCVACATGATCNERTGRCDAPGCAALRCPAGALVDCRGASPRCVLPCEGVACPIGSRCDTTSGRCARDLCAGVSCPTGTLCEEGRCVRVTRPDAGALDSGTTADAMTPRDASEKTDRGTPMPGDGGSVDGLLVEAPPQPGCGCHAPGTTRGRFAWVALIAVLIARRRSRVRAKQGGTPRACRSTCGA